MMTPVVRHKHLQDIQDYLCVRYRLLVESTTSQESPEVKAELDKLDALIISIDNILTDDWSKAS